MIPRGSLTRDQLSSLLLGYVSNSADILEIFTTFEEQELLGERAVGFAIMSVFTLSVYQFALVSTATMNSEEIANNIGTVVKNKVHPHSLATMQTQSKPSRNDNISKIRTMDLTLQHTKAKDKRGKGRNLPPHIRKVTQFSTNPILSGGIILPRANTLPSPTRANTLPSIYHKREKVDISATKEKEKEKENSTERRSIHGEIFQILVTLLMQDGPFLILRAYLIIKYGVASEMHIFFTCKNAIVSILLVHRLLILSCGEKEAETDRHREEVETKLRNIRQTIENM